MLLRFAALTLLAVAVSLASGADDIAAGKLAFARCASCHQIGPSARSVFGPQLNGIVGRRAAAAADYRYSEAMRKSGIVWDEQRLAAFLRAPDKAVPGTSMRFWGLSDEKQIAGLLAYLRTFTPKGDQQ